MKIIYITPLWSGLKPFFLEGDERPTGMPAFYEVFIRLLEAKNMEKIYIILFSETTKFNIPIKYRDKIQLIPINSSKRILKPVKYLHALIRIILICRNKKIKFVYGHGPVSFIAGLSTLFCKVKAFHRVYGTFFINEINSTKLKLFLKYPFAYMSYSIKSNGLIITNDGTHADIVFEKIGNKKTPLHFLMNGINKTPTILKRDEINYIGEKKYAVYVARLDRWKRQHLFIEIISKAAAKGVKIDGYIIGQIYDNQYYQELSEMIKINHLENQIKIIPGLPRDQINHYLKYSICSFSLYNTSNLGNVLLESLSLGVPVIAFNVNNSLDYLDQNCFISINNEDIDIAVESLISLYSDNNLRNEYASKALSYSNMFIKTWDVRCEKELEILKR